MNGINNFNTSNSSSTPAQRPNALFKVNITRSDSASWSTSPTTPTSPEASTFHNDGSQFATLSTRANVGIGIGLGVLGVAFAVTLAFLYRTRKRGRRCNYAGGIPEIRVDPPAEWDESVHTNGTLVKWAGDMSANVMGSFELDG